MTERIYIFKRFERFWHCSQALLIMFMMTTGFEVHGLYTLFGFKMQWVFTPLTHGHSSLCGYLLFSGISSQANGSSIFQLWTKPMRC